MKKLYMQIDGIFCDHCRAVLTDALLQEPEIQSVKIRNNTAYIVCNSEPNYAAWVRRVNGLGYYTKQEYIREKPAKGIRFSEFVWILLLLLLAAHLLQCAFGYNIFNVIPTIDSSITYGMLIVTGLFTSIHCISMCGAINLTAVFQNKGGSFLQPLLYNAGRLLSYTLIGCAVGALGSVLRISETLSGVIILLAAVFMLLMALRMLGILDLPSVKCAPQKAAGTKNAFLIGILNGFMPCGPLQAMQLYALSTGSAWLGGLSMFLFGLGTVPLMLSMGMLVHVLKGKWRVRINKVASVLILLLSIVMLNRGLLAVGFDVSGLLSPDKDYDQYIAATIEDGYQTVDTTLDYSSYGDIVVQKDIPVQFHIHVDSDHLTGCNNEVLLKDFGIDCKLEPGDNIIEFTPAETGDYTYTCWMHMISNSIKVIDDIDYFEGS